MTRAEWHQSFSLGKIYKFELQRPKQITHKIIILNYFCYTVLKGVNLALKWGIKRDESKDWFRSSLVNSIVEESRRIRTKVGREMIIKLRCGIQRLLITAFGLKVKSVFVPSEKNKMDAQMRVNKKWSVNEENVVPTCGLGINELNELHSMRHMDVNRTLYLVQKVEPLIKRKEVWREVRNCIRCQSIDPAPITLDPGEIGTTKN